MVRHWNVAHTDGDDGQNDSALYLKYHEAIVASNVENDETRQESLRRRKRDRLRETDEERQTRLMNKKLDKHKVKPHF